MKRKLRIAVFSLLLLINISMFAQVKKLISEISSLNTKEIMTFRYNNKNQLIYFDEKGIVTYREFTLKYDKVNGQLSECVINQDRGELILNIKYYYDNTEYIREEVKSSGKKLQGKTTETNNIYLDDKRRLTKTTFDDGKLWEEFKYDDNNNVVAYTIHSTLGDSDSFTTYKFNDKNSVFSDIESLPTWFWALHLNNMKWIDGFVGRNMPVEYTTEDPRYGVETIEITYDYDNDGYPVKQYYDGVLVKEFRYKLAK